MYVNLIESVRQSKNQVEIIASVEDEKTGDEFLGIANFFLKSNETLIQDEDELGYFLEDLDLVWDVYVPVYVD